MYSDETTPEEHRMKITQVNNGVELYDVHGGVICGTIGVPGFLESQPPVIVKLRHRRADINGQIAHLLLYYSIYFTLYNIIIFKERNPAKSYQFTTYHSTGIGYTI